jgi:hypothetical protein
VAFKKEKGFIVVTLFSVLHFLSTYQPPLLATTAGPWHLKRKKAL